MGDVIPLVPDLATQLLKDDSFITDMARYQEKLLTEKYLRKKYGNLDEASWTRLAECDELLEAIESESIRRMRNGSTKREKSQQLITKAPAILDSIMSSGSEVSPRHKIDAIKTLDDMAANGPAAAAAAGAVFSIVINLGADENGKQIIERYDKPIKIDANYTDADINVEPTPTAIAIDVGTDDVDNKPQLTPATTPTVTASKDDPVQAALNALMQIGD